MIGSYNIQSGQSQHGCVASASKIPSEYTSVASTKNDNALTWVVIQFEMKNSCVSRLHWSVFLLITVRPVLFIRVILDERFWMEWFGCWTFRMGWYIGIVAGPADSVGF